MSGWWPWPIPAKPSDSPLMFHRERKDAVGGTTENLRYALGERCYLRHVSAYNNTDIGTIHLYLLDRRTGDIVHHNLAFKQTSYAGEPINYEPPVNLIVANPNAVQAEFWNTTAGDDLVLSVLTERI
jgi:hypothetical protein